MCACRETCLGAGGRNSRVGDGGVTRSGKDGLLYKNSVAGGAISAHCKARLGAGRGYRIYRQCGMPKCVNVAIDVRAAAMAGVGGVSSFGAG